MKLTSKAAEIKKDVIKVAKPKIKKTRQIEIEIKGMNPLL